MTAQLQPVITLVIPVYNEADGLTHFHSSLKEVLKKDGLLDTTEIIYCDDGSSDSSQTVLKEISRNDIHVKVIIFSRNFGKESALTAGIASATGKAIITLDSDGQHPVEMIPTFVEAWRNGARIVIGVRKRSETSWIKRLQSKTFYGIFNRLSGQKLIPGSTDFRLIDGSVQKEFMLLGESNRMTRGLIDWLGFNPVYLPYEEKKRKYGKASYNQLKLIRLGMDSLVSLSPRPLYLLGYLGMLLTVFALILGIVVGFEQVLLADPFRWHFTGTAMLGILMLFFIGIVLISQGVLAVYVSHIHTESKNRPLYIIDHAKSEGFERNK